MYIYFDRNGTIKEVINDESIRRGSSDYNKIYCYLEGNPDIDDIWYLQKNPDGTLTNEVSFVDNIVTKAIPYDSHRDMKYFQDFEEYQFYVFTLSSSYLLQSGLVVATIRVAENNTLWALGELTFNVQANVINSDNEITQSQYDYLLITISSYYSKTEIDNKLNLKADKSDTYTKTEVDDKLDLKADKNNVYTKQEVNEVALGIMSDVDGLRGMVGDLSDTTTQLENDVANLKSTHNVIDLVSTYSALQSYDTSNLHIDDKIQVIADETHDGVSTVYNWSGSAWQYVGAYGANSYTKTESDTKFAPKTTAVTHDGNQLKDNNGNNIYPNINEDSIPNQSIDYSKIITGTLGYVTPEMFGAVGDGLTDDTLALQSAINSGKMVLLTNKTYLISDSLINPLCIIGVSQRTSIILMDGNQPIIKFTEDVPGGVLKSLGLARKKTIDITSLTSAIGIKINDNVTLGHYIFDNVYISHTYTGFEAKSNSNIYSCSISNIWINDFSKYGIYFVCRGATGCVFSNIYITNWKDYTTLTLGTCDSGIHLQNFSESILQQINIEHTIIKNCLTFNGCDNMKVESLHIEGIVPYEDYAGFIVNVFSSRVIIDTLMMGFSGNNSQGYESASSVTLSNAYLFGVKNDNILLWIKSVYLRNNDFTYVSKNKRVCYFNNNINDVALIIEYFNDRSNIFSGFQGNRTNRRLPYCKQLNNLKYYELINNRNVLLYVDNNPNNINYKGFFEMGDRFQAQTPISNVSEWICASRGTFEEPSMTALGKFTQYQSSLYLTSNEDTDLTINTSIKIGDNYYITNSNIYESSTYPSYPYAINLKSPINNPTAEDVELKIGKPVLKTINVE